jgi:zinc transport system substrate-binding protein
MDSRKTIAICLCSVWIVTVLAAFPHWANGGNAKSEILTIYVVNYPLKYFAERIAGGHAKVEFPCPSDEDPAYWKPDISTISAYQKADLILLNGAGYAKWVNKVSLPGSKIVNTSAKFKGEYVKMSETTTHSHGPEGRHAHETIAFTTWLDFSLASKQARAIADALSRRMPALRETFKNNCLALEKDLLALDRQMRKMVVKNQRQPLVASHPVYQYLARRYGLNLKSVHWEPDEFPGERQWALLREKVKSFPAKWMIWESDANTTTVEKLMSVGIQSLVFDPCGNTPAKGDFLSVMQRNVGTLRKAFE